MDYKTLTDEQLQTERQNIMNEIARRNDLADIPKQAEEMALRGSKSELAQIVNDAKAEQPVVVEQPDDSEDTPTEEE